MMHTTQLGKQPDEVIGCILDAGEDAKTEILVLNACASP